MRSLEEKLEFKKKLEARTAEFAVSVFRYLDQLPGCVSSKVIAFQLGKSASSVGANYREANRAESAEDFEHKLGIALKECSETFYWLELLRKLHPDDECVFEMLNECDELIRIFQSARSKLSSKRRA